MELNKMYSDLPTPDYTFKDLSCPRTIVSESPIVHHMITTNCSKDLFYLNIVILPLTVNYVEIIVKKMLYCIQIRYNIYKNK